MMKKEKHYLEDENLSLKAKGLLTQMLFLPANWNFSIENLERKNKEKYHSIMVTLRELERAGYLIRIRTRNKDGTLKKTDYIFSETRK